MQTIVPKSSEDTPHSEDMYFFATNKGWFKNIPTLFGTAQVKSEQPPPGLDEWKPSFLLNDLKLPGWVIYQAHDFFLNVFEKQNTECSVYILYNRKKEEFKLFAPEQYVTHSSVNHKLDREKLPKGFQTVGTIHSHCDFAGFHSGTDKADMKKMPGLHGTIGHVNSKDPEIVFALSVGDNVFDVELDDIIDWDITENRYGYSTMPPYWLEFVHTGHAPWGNTGVNTSHATHTYQKKPVPMKSVSYPRHNLTSPSNWHQSSWDDDDWDMPLLPELSTDDRDTEDPFTEYAGAVKYVEDEMAELTAWINQMGFTCSFSLIYNPERAEKQLTTFMERTMQDDASTI